MFINRQTNFKMLLTWSRYEILFLLIYSGAVVTLYYFSPSLLPQTPWSLIALLGIVTSFLISFQNNATYGRVWEARKIWGGIVNDSRSWASLVHASCNSLHNHATHDTAKLDAIRHELIKRHLAWVTALRYQLRTEKQEWEVLHLHQTNQEWLNIIYTPEVQEPLAPLLKKYLQPDDITAINKVNNHSSAILFQQSQRLKELESEGYLWEFNILELHNIIARLYAFQGKSERIKNFPYPRQYTTFGRYCLTFFITLLPLSMMPYFTETASTLALKYTWGDYYIWLLVPLYTIIAWIFITMERVGRSGENPFEGSPTDVPISAISRGIERNLLQLLGQKDIPDPFPTFYDIQM